MIFFILAASPFLRAEVVKGSTIGCQQDVAEFKQLVMTSQVLLNKNFMSNDSKSQISEAIDWQLKHLFGYFNNSRNQNNLNVALSGYRQSPIIVEVKNAKYSSKLVVQNYLADQPYVFPLTEYVKKALKRGFTEEADDAVLITYKVSLIVADCSFVEFPASRVIKLPLDPYVSLWLEEPAKRGARTFNGKTQEKVSNCSADEVANFGQNGIAWFFWKPQNCELNSNAVVMPSFEVKQKLSSVAELTKDFFKDKNKLKFSAVFGVISYLDFFSKLNYDKVNQLASSNLTHCVAAKNIPECFTFWKPAFQIQGDEKFLEPGAIGFFVYLRHLTTLVKVKKFSTENSAEQISYKIEGVLRDSGVPVEATVYYGKTNFNSNTPVPTNYISFLHDALASSDAISYYGHAGLGVNLNYKRLVAEFKKMNLANIQRKKNLWYGIYNCEAFSYFGWDMQSIFKSGQKMLLTASSGIEVGSWSPVLQIEIINRIFANSNYEKFSMLNHYVQSQDFITATQIEY